MRNTFFISLALALSLPLCAYAAGINSVTTASSETGGNVSNGTTTSGNAGASAYVRNTTGARGTTSTIEIEVKTEGKGVVRIESVKKNIEKEAAVAVQVRQLAESSSTAVKVVSEKKFFTLEPFQSLFRSFLDFFRFF